VTDSPSRLGHADIEITGEEVVYDGFWQLKLIRLRHRRFDGGWSAELRRELHCRGEAVGVLLYDPQLDAIAMVEQIRIGALSRPQSPWLFELVAGLLEPGETPKEVAIRESQEEAGCAIDEMRHIASYYSSPGGTDEYFHLFCARANLAGAAELHGVAGEHEDIRLHVFEYPDALRMQSEGRFDNAHSLIALLWLQQQRDELRRAWN
jgi:ADP-ribose pyrophosphatase